MKQLQFCLIVFALLSLSLGCLNEQDDSESMNNASATGGAAGGDDGTFW